jgi:hypothetical protein
MARRKFYYHDIALVNKKSRSSHTGHRARIFKTLIHVTDGNRGKTVYDVDCECGSILRFDANKLDYVSELGSFPDTRQEACVAFFLEMTGISDTVSLYEALEALQQKTQVIIQRRFGLNSYGKRETLREIGEDYHITRERVRQIIANGLTKMARKPVAKDALVVSA